MVAVLAPAADARCNSKQHMLLLHLYQANSFISVGLRFFRIITTVTATTLRGQEEKQWIPILDSSVRSDHEWSPESCSPDTECQAGTDANLRVFGLTRWGIEPSTYRSEAYT